VRIGLLGFFTRVNGASSPREEDDYRIMQRTWSGRTNETTMW
jgi:hypothetical protein